MDLLYFLTLLLLTVVVERIKGNVDKSLPANTLSGKELRVAFTEIGSAAQIYRNSTGHVIGYAGIFWEQLNWHARQSNFSFDMKISADNSFGILRNGNWTGIRGQLQRGEVDLACNPNTGMGARDIVELAVYIFGDANAMFMKYPKPTTAIDGPIIVFSPNVWICLLVSMISCVGFIQLFTFLARKRVDGQQKYPEANASDTSMYILGTLTNHSVRSNKGLRSVEIVSFIWLLSTFVFVNIYSSCMSSFMSLSYQRPEYSTYKALADNPKQEPCTLKGASGYFLFMDAQPGTYQRKIGDKLRRCGDGCSSTRFDEVIKNALEGKCVALSATTVGNYFTRKHISNRECHLTMGQEKVFFLNMYWEVPKNSPYVMELNKASWWWHSFGLQQYWMEKLGQFTPRQCKLDYNNQGVVVKLVERARLKLEQFYVPFLLLFIGYGLALIQFIIENFTDQMKRRR